jgi:hypothetical protein
LASASAATYEIAFAVRPTGAVARRLLPNRSYKSCKYGHTPITVLEHSVERGILRLDLLTPRARLELMVRQPFDLGVLHLLASHDFPPSKFQPTLGQGALSAARRRGLDRPQGAAQSTAMTVVRAVTEYFLSCFLGF